MELQLSANLGVLNDLIDVNGQRIWSYQGLLAGTDDKRRDEQLNLIVEEVVIQGQRLQEELELEYVDLAQDLPVKGATSGTVLHAWDLVMSLFADERSKSIRELLGKGERAFITAYRHAGAHPALVPPVNRLIQRQARELSLFYSRYKRFYQSCRLI